MKSKAMRIVYVFVIVFISPVLNANAQLPVVTTDTLYSKVLAEQRIIQAIFPPGFDSKKKYDMLYVLDGEAFGTTAEQILSISEDFEFTPPMIVISIRNGDMDSNHVNSRNRDFLPLEVEGYAYSGGSDKFLTFIRSELMPFVNRKYPSSGNNVLFGHSYGGLFALYTLFTQPDLFQSYIASDPSLWWNDGFVNKLAIKNITKIYNRDRTLYFAGRAGNLFRALGSYGMDSILKVKSPPGFKWKSAVYDNELHQSMRIKTLYDGLKFTYFGYSPTSASSYIDNSLRFFPGDGILLQDKPINLMIYTTFLDYEPGIRYTTDGTEPTASSPKFEFSRPISAPADLTLKLFTTQGDKQITKGHFEVGGTFPGHSLPKSALPGGFRYDYYKGSWDDLPDLTKLRSQKSGLAKMYIRDYISDTFHFACKIEGYLRIVKEGYYTFFLQADDRARLYLDDKELMSIDVKKDSLNSRSFIVPLENGFYPIKIEYLHRVGQPNLRLSFVPPTENDIFVPGLPIPLKFQYSKS
jgi:predicted alpha/beta superfamily hydrolase